MCLLYTAAAAGQSSPAQNSGLTFKSAVREVVVPVVVRDAKGHAVANLKKEDFEIFDRGKPQTIREVRVEGRVAIGNGYNASPFEVIPKWAVSPNRFVVFLFDDLHLGLAELAQVQRAAIKIISTSLTPNDMAAVVSLSGSNTGLIQDRGVLLEAVKKLHARGLYQQVDSDCPKVDYYQADLIENKHNASALEAAIDSALSCGNFDTRMVAEKMVDAAVRQALVIGDQDVRVTLRSIADFVRRMGSLPGERVLILITPGFLTVTQEAMIDKSTIVDMAIRANVTVSALDARGLYTTELDASQRGTDSTGSLTTGSTSEYHRSSTTLKEDVMAELADGTGGRFFHNNNDLESGLRQLTTAPEYLYLLEFSPQDVKEDGSYHALTVKVKQSGVKVQARRGYFAAKPEKKK